MVEQRLAVDRLAGALGLQEDAVDSLVGVYAAPPARPGGEILRLAALGDYLYGARLVHEALAGVRVAARRFREASETAWPEVAGGGAVVVAKARRLAEEQCRWG